MEKKYFKLDTEEKIINYVRTHPILNGIFLGETKLNVRDLADGNLNFVYAITSVRDPEKSVLIKQALPHLRVMKSWKLFKERLEFEANYYEFCKILEIRSIPEFYGYDEIMCVIIMENLKDHTVLRKGLTQGNIYQRVGNDIGHFLAVMLYMTSDYHMSYKEKSEATKKFTNPHLCEMTHRAVFTNPYDPQIFENGSRHYNPFLKDQVKSMQSDQELKAGVMAMKYGFMNKNQALIHGDFHSGSIMVNKNDTRIIDPEFCFFGPMGFDIGAIIGNFFLNYAAQTVKMKDQNIRETFQSYLLKMVRDIWHVFLREFEQRWSVEADFFGTPVYRRNYFREILQDTAGYAGCKMIRRVMGCRSLVEDLATIEDEQERAQAESLIMEIGRNLIINRSGFENIEDLIDICRKSSPLFVKNSS